MLEGLQALREQIDAIDRRLLDDLNERSQLVQRVGELKRDKRGVVYDASREQEIVARLARENSGPFPTAGLAPVFREIISATRSLEEVLKVGYFGPEGTFTHLAAVERFGDLVDHVSYPSISDVFAAIERDKVSLGIVPIENTTEGIVTATYDALASCSEEITICGESRRRISNDLMSQSGRMEDIERVVSHPQPLAQCRGWLDRNLRGVPRVETASTAAAAQLAAEDGAVAAIGSSMAARVYGLETVESSIEDRSDNTTRFLLIGRNMPAASGGDLTLMLFTIRRDEAGGLFRLLEPFSELGINLSWIQLRPMEGKPWEYVFFLEAEGHVSDERMSRALALAAEAAHSHRVLGSYPREGRGQVGDRDGNSDSARRGRA